VRSHQRLRARGGTLARTRAMAETYRREHPRCGLPPFLTCTPPPPVRTHVCQCTPQTARPNRSCSDKPTYVRVPMPKLGSRKYIFTTAHLSSIYLYNSTSERGEEGGRKQRAREAPLRLSSVPGAAAAVGYPRPPPRASPRPGSSSPTPEKFFHY